MIQGMISHALFHLTSTSQRAFLGLIFMALIGNTASATDPNPEYRWIPPIASSERTASTSIAPLINQAHWSRSHGGDANTRFSSLDQIHRGNVHQLQLAWTYTSGDRVGNIQCNPIIVDGVMFTPTPDSAIVAVDGATGQEIWKFQAEGVVAHRGLTYWEGTEEISPAIFFNSNSKLYALEPTTGQLHPGLAGTGVIPVPHFKVPPALWKNLIIFAGYDKDVLAYDLKTGDRVWEFHTLPHPGEFGHDTWSNVESGANAWGGIALDRPRGIVYVTTGSPKPNFDGAGHTGDNLFANCVLAIQAETGKRLWHFQDIRHDIWDLDLPAPPILVSMEKDGKRIDAVAALSKTGNTLLLDRLTGQPIFPFRLRRAPESRLPGEITSEWQPSIELPEPFARQEFTLDDITQLNPTAHDHILQRARQANFGWFEPFEAGKPTILFGIHGGAEWTGGAHDPYNGTLFVSSNELPWIITVVPVNSLYRYDPNRQPTTGEAIYQTRCIACHGRNREGVGTAPALLALNQRLTANEIREVIRQGRNLMPPNPDLSDEDLSALAEFLLDQDRSNNASNSDDPILKPEYTFLGFQKLLDPEGYPGVTPPWGTLNAIDLSSGKIKWQVPLGEHEALTKRGIGITGTENFGGPTVTAGGLVFCGGTRDRKIRAFDVDTGVELWSYQLPFGGYAPPSSYEVNGQQYIVIPATGGGKLGGPVGSAWVAFTLPSSDQ